MPFFDRPPTPTRIVVTGWIALTILAGISLVAGVFAVDLIRALGGGS